MSRDERGSKYWDVHLHQGIDGMDCAVASVKRHDDLHRQVSHRSPTDTDPQRPQAPTLLPCTMRARQPRYAAADADHPDELRRAEEHSVQTRAISEPLIMMAQSRNIT